LLLARLFARPANVLVLDEPTNDLDIDTLELLEGLLQDFKGTLFLVSHDRSFIDHVVTQSIVSEGNGVWREYAGGYEDWKRAKARTETRPAATEKSAAPSTASAPVARPVSRKLSYKESRELAQIPDQIAALEQEQAQIATRLSDANLYRDDPKAALALQARTMAIESALLALLERWEVLGGAA